jgi:hypothetical protein
VHLNKHSKYRYLQENLHQQRHRQQLYLLAVLAVVVVVQPVVELEVVEILFY